MYGLTADRRALYSSINARVGRMLKAGALDEAKRLKDRKLSRTAGAMIGLKELSEFLDGRCGLAEAEELMKRNTRRFAKRQLAWFRADKRITWFDIGKLSKSEIVKEIASALPPSQSTRDDSMLRRTSRASQ
jgi:tRNA dimethylallyltransferase